MALGDIQGGSIKDVYTKIRDLFEVFKRTILPTKLYPINDTTAVTGINGFAIQFITDTVIDSITTGFIDSNAPWSDLDTETFSAGTIIYVRFSGITLASGAVICYIY
jgi:hypothetical protein